MSDKVLPPQLVESTGSDQGDSSSDEKRRAPPQTETAQYIDANASRRRFAFGAQGKPLLRTIMACGAIGFLLFGYDQGVLGVSTSLGSR